MPMDAYYPPPAAPAFSVPTEHHLHAGYSHAVLRRWAAGPAASPSKSALVWPLFLLSGDASAKQPIASMPGQFRWGVARLAEALDGPVARGLRAVILFGVEPDAARKDAVGSGADAPGAPVPAAIAFIRARYPDVLVMADVCLCGYTSHGHCGVLREAAGAWALDNAASVTRLGAVALAFARAGAHVLAPSDMMDGRVGAIKAALRAADGGALLSRVAVCSYAAKFASCMYGPFRDAAASGAAFGDRSGYQLPVGGRALALRAVARDVAEGADLVIVKPGGGFLDIARDVARDTPVPVAAYQVSGEYAMIVHAAAAGAFEYKAAVLESLASFARAGVTVVISYFAPEVCEWICEEEEAAVARARAVA
jgi:porphobilinogen synthase